MTNRLRTLLGESPQLRPLLEQAQDLARLQQAFSAVAPDWLAGSSRVLGLKFGTLTIATSNPSVAAKLRQLAPELVVLMQNKGHEVSGIRIRTQVGYTPAPQRQAPRILSNTARHALDSLGEDLPDSPLKQALLRMSKR